MLIDAVLSIKYDGGSHPQGKYFSRGKHRYYIANIDEYKLFKTFNGYAISKAILDSFSRSGLKNINIIYRYPEKGLYYLATPSQFTSKGILVPYGGHEQYVLPLKNWKVVNGTFNTDPKNLPVIDVKKWEKGEIEYEFIGNHAYPKEEKVTEQLAGV